MKWFRSNIRDGARLALFALFVQFALSFGHFHALAASSVGGAHLTPLSAAIDTGQFVVDSPAQPQQTPRNHDRERPDSCAICAVVTMASTVLFALQILLLPQAAEFCYCTTNAEFSYLKLAGASFQPRAPPAS